MKINHIPPKIWGRKLTVDGRPIDPHVTDIERELLMAVERQAREAQDWTRAVLCQVALRSVPDEASWGELEEDVQRRLVALWRGGGGRWKRAAVVRMVMREWFPPAWRTWQERYG